MRSLVIATLASAAFVGSALVADKNIDLNAPVVTQALVDEINNKPGNTWTAAMPSGQHAGITQGEFRKLLGVRPETEEDKKLRASVPTRKFSDDELAKDIPEAFDSAKQWPECVTIPHIYDQSQCGSCWAVAGAGVMSDRVCTYGGQKNLFISARDLTGCGWGLGCNGGNPLLAFWYYQQNGLVSEACQPYPFPPCGRNSTLPPCPSEPYATPACLSNCSVAGQKPVKYFGNTTYAVSGEEAFQREIMANGPVEVGFFVFDDFMAYKSGVYQYTSGSFRGGHAVRIVGWGVLNGVKYWKVANSWNTNWGMDGYFLIKRGDNQCNIEMLATAGAPKL